MMTSVMVLKELLEPHALAWPHWHAHRAAMPACRWLVMLLFLACMAEKEFAIVDEKSPIKARVS